MSAAEPLLEESPLLEVVIPVHNEEVALADTVHRVTRHLDTLPWTWQVTIADNASTDGTPLEAHRLAREYPGVRVVTLAEKGRGRALKRVWSESDAEVLAYMDVDLSTDLNALMPLVAPLLSGHSDLAIGSRLTRGSNVVRGPRRELVSRGYNVLLRSTLRTRFSDAQCGFKAIRRPVAQALLPLVEDDTWFFDTELLVLAERSGMRIHEVPVDWVDDPDSRVDVLRTALDDLRGIRRLGWSLLTGRLPLATVSAELGRARASAAAGRTGSQIAIFVLIGIASTAAYAVLFLLLRTVDGRAAGQPAGAAADRDRQHRGQPAADVRGPRAAAPGAAPAPGTGGVRRRAGDDQRLAVPAARAGVRAAPGRGGAGADRGQPGGDADAVRGDAGLDLQAGRLSRNISAGRPRPPGAGSRRPVASTICWVVFTLRWKLPASSSWPSTAS